MNLKFNFFYENNKSFKNFLIYFITLSTFLIYFYFNFLDLEDSDVFFNRANYLNSSFFYYYNGQIHPNAQILANLTSIFPPYLQALLYSFYCLFSFCLVLFLLNKIIQKEYLLLYVIYVCSFYTVLIYNVANSLWTAILIGYLIIYLVSIKK